MPVSTRGMAGPLHLKVFLSSPGDVAAERELARRLIKDELPYDPLLAEMGVPAVSMNLVDWLAQASPYSAAGSGKLYFRPVSIVRPVTERRMRVKMMASFE